MGESGDCIGLKIVTWKADEIEFKFGPAYSQYSPLASGDQFALHVGASTSFGTVTCDAPTILKLNRTSGPTTGGTKIKITGKDLKGATSLMFGSVRATRLDVSASGGSIVAYTPAEAAGQVDVTVTTPDGTSVLTPADRFTFG